MARSNMLDGFSFRCETEFHRLIKIMSLFDTKNGTIDMTIALYLELEKTRHRTEIAKETTIKGISDVHLKWIKLYEKKIATKIKGKKPKITIGEELPKENVWENA